MFNRKITQNDIKTELIILDESAFLEEEEEEKYKPVLNLKNEINE